MRKFIARISKNTEGIWIARTRYLTNATKVTFHTTKAQALGRIAKEVACISMIGSLY